MIATTRYITPPELAKRWHVKLANIYSWIRSGELNAINMSSGEERPRWRLTEADVSDFERRRRTTASPGSARKQRRSIPTPAKNHFADI